jgi:hypothetical protein
MWNKCLRSDFFGPTKTLKNSPHGNFSLQNLLAQKMEKPSLQQSVLKGREKGIRFWKNNLSAFCGSFGNWPMLWKCKIGCHVIFHSLEDFFLWGDQWFCYRYGWDALCTWHHIPNISLHYISLRRPDPMDRTTNAALCTRLRYNSPISYVLYYR